MRGLRHTRAAAAFLSAVTFAMTIDVMRIAARNGGHARFGNGVYPGFGTDLLEAVRGTDPRVGWAVVLVALIFLYAAAVPGKGPRRLTRGTMRPRS